MILNVWNLLHDFKCLESNFLTGGYNTNLFNLTWWNLLVFILPGSVSSRLDCLPLIFDAPLGDSNKQNHVKEHFIQYQQNKIRNIP